MELVSTQAEVEKCEHFTIRGFVAEVRKKDRKLCWPFSFEEEGEQLPPLHAPTFRYWACENQFENVETKSMDENREMDNSNSSRPQQCAKHSHMDAHLPSQDVSSMSLSGSQPESGERTSEEKKDDTSVIPYANEVGNSKLFTLDIHEDQAETKEDGYPSTNDVVTAVNYNHSESNGDVTIQNVNQDICRSESHSTLKDANETSPAMMLVKMKRKCMREGKIERYNKKPGTSRKNPSKVNQGRKDVSDSIFPAAISIDSCKDETTNSLTVHKRKLHPLELDESDDEISEEETATHHDNLGGPSHKKRPRKSRMLNDILKRAPLTVSKQGYGHNEDDFVDLVGTESEQSGSESDTTLGIDLNRSPTHQVDKKRKKKIIEDGETMLNSFQESVTKKVGEVAIGDNHTGCVNDHMVTSNKLKVKNTSAGGGVHSEVEPPMAGQNDGTNNSSSLVTRVLDRMFPLNASKGSSVPQLKIGDSSFRHQMENPTLSRSRPDSLKQQVDQRPYKSSDNSQDDIPMDIVELMAKNQHERLLEASANRNYLSAKVNNSIPTDSGKATGNKIPRFLQEKKSEKQRSKSSNEAKRIGSSNLIQLANHVSQFSTANEINRLPEQSLASTFSKSKDKELDEAQLLMASSCRNFNSQNSSFLKNQGKQTSPQFLAGSSSRESSRQNSMFVKNWEKPPNEAQFLFGSSTSTRDFGNYNLTSSKSQDTSSEVQFLFGGSSRARGNENSTFSKNPEKTPNSGQFLAGNSSNFCGHQNSSWEGTYGHRYAQNSSQIPDQYRTSQSVAWQNSYTDDRHAWSSMVPNSLPFQSSKTRKFAAESNATNKRTQCLDFFPKQNINVDPSLKPINPPANHVEKKRMNLDIGATKRTQLGYPFACRESGVQLNPQSMGPLGLHNNDKIPATHLLRLMDAGMSPGTAINGDVNQKFTPQHCLLRDYRQQESSEFGHSKTNETLNIPPLAMCFDRPHHSRKFGENFPSFHEVQTLASSTPQLPDGHTVGCFSSVPAANAVSYSMKRNGVVENRCGSQLKGKTKSKEAPTRFKSTNNAVSGDGNSVKKHGLSPMCDLGKRIMCTPESMGSPAHPLTMKNSTKRAELEVNKAGTDSPRKESRSTEDCSLNRNPAEFTLPEPGNEFMNGPQDFKAKKNTLSPDNTKLIQLLGNKRQKIVKLAAIRDM